MRMIRHFNRTDLRWTIGVLREHLRIHRLKMRGLRIWDSVFYRWLAVFAAKVVGRWHRNTEDWHRHRFEERKAALKTLQGVFKGWTAAAVRSALWRWKLNRLLVWMGYMSTWGRIALIQAPFMLQLRAAAWTALRQWRVHQISSDLEQALRKHTLLRRKMQRKGFHRLHMWIIKGRVAVMHNILRCWHREAMADNLFQGYQLKLPLLRRLYSVFLECTWSVVQRAVGSFRARSRLASLAIRCQLSLMTRAGLHTWHETWMAWVIFKEIEERRLAEEARVRERMRRAAQRIMLVNKDWQDTAMLDVIARWVERAEGFHEEQHQLALRLQKEREAERRLQASIREAATECAGVILEELLDAVKEIARENEVIRASQARQRKAEEEELRLAEEAAADDSPSDEEPSDDPMVQARRTVARSNRRRKVLAALTASAQGRNRSVKSLIVALAKGRRLSEKLARESSDSIEAAVLPGLLQQVEAQLRIERDASQKKPVRVRPASAKVVTSTWQGLEGSADAFRSVVLEKHVVPKIQRPIQQDEGTVAGRWMRGATKSGGKPPVVHGR